MSQPPENQRHPLPYSLLKPSRKPSRRLRIPLPHLCQPTHLLHHHLNLTPLLFRYLQLQLQLLHQLPSQHLRRRRLSRHRPNLPLLPPLQLAMAVINPIQVR